MRLLDHVAIHVADREAFAAELTSLLDVHVIEQTERFTLVGADADHGKVTLLDAVDEREPLPNRIVSLSLAAPGAGSPTPIELSCGIVCTFVDTAELGEEWSSVPRHALVGLTLRTDQPMASADTLVEQHAMRIESATPDVAMLAVGASDADGRITLTKEPWTDYFGPSMLDHVGIRIDDAEECRADAQDAGLDVVKWVEAPHSKAVFVAGPDQLLLEFVEQTQPFDEA